MFPLLLGSDRSTLLGKALRVDVENNDDGAPYSIPSDNPFLWEKETRPGKSIKILYLWNDMFISGGF